MTEPIIKPWQIRSSSVPTWFGLILGSWFGLIWGSILSAPIGVGFGVAAGSLLGGFLAVPIWGTFWGLIGLSGQRNGAVRRHGITLLKEDDPLSQRVYVLAAKLGLAHRPWVGTMSHNNAYAIGSGPHNALVVIGQPLLNNLTVVEVDAIVGHELGHVANNDMRRMGLAYSFQNALVWYLGFSNTLQRWARWLLTWLSELFVLGLSRRREYWADAIGAVLTSKADMMSALEKLHASPDLSSFERQHARLMFRGRTGGSLFSTHPTLQQRLWALEGERYTRRIPLLAPVKQDTQPPVALPKAEDIAYAKT